MKSQVSQFMYTHYSKVRTEDLAPWNLTPDNAQKLAQVFEREAFQDASDYNWYAFDGTGTESILLNNSLNLRILQYAGAQDK